MRLRVRPPGLQWRLTLSYTLVTVAVVLALEAVFLAITDRVVFESDLLPTYLASALAQSAPEAAPFLVQTPPDRTGLASWVRNLERTKEMSLPFGIVLAHGEITSLDVVDREGRLVATDGGQGPALGEALAPHLSPAAAAVLRSALAGRVDPTHLAVRETDGNLAVASPIFGSDGQLLGALFFVPSLPSGFSLFFHRAIATFLTSVVPLTAIFGLMGTFFGFVWARWLTHRLRLLSESADAWSRGDLGTVARDVSDDELGQLARHLNRMAEQLQTLLQTRQELAVVEERQRLARDLHDAVKQQVFATAMQVGAARALLDRNPTAAGSHLIEAERLAGQAQQELNVLIRELRPAALTDKGLVAALQELVRDWSRRTNVAAELRVQGERASPLNVEQAFFRVAQEALANVARHSGATVVDVHLAWQGEELRLVVSDNGRGFDVTRAKGKGLGLANMQERMTALGGTLEVLSTTRGTRLEARVGLAPLAVAADPLVGQPIARI